MQSKPANMENAEGEADQTFENPSYRRIYGKISMDEMIGGKPSETANETEKSTKESPSSNQPTDLDFYYDDYYEEDDDEESDEYEDPNDEEEEEVKAKLLSKETTDKPKASQLSDIDLPDGWERHEDELGSYFWHIPTGTIQRERPFLHTIDKSMIRSDSLVFLDKSAINVDYNPADCSILEEPDKVNEDEENKAPSVTRNRSISSKKKVIANLKLTFQSDEEDDSNKSASEEPPLSFVVHSLGWVEVDESQINSKTGSMVIKRAIHQLTSKPDGAARCWGVGETQRLVMRLSREKICLLDAVTETVLTIQLIREIRMWAVDEANNFAYVVRERKPFNVSSPEGKPATNSTIASPLKCHVFHCDEVENKSADAAQKIALYLKEALMNIKNQLAASNKASGKLQGSPRRPRTLFPAQASPSSANKTNPVELNADHLAAEVYEFPTPIEEPKKVLPAFYMGSIPVDKPMGVEVLNIAIQEVVNSLKASLTNGQTCETELMRPVMVHISPSSIIVECSQSGSTIFECRVRFVCFCLWFILW